MRDIFELLISIILATVFGIGFIVIAGFVFFIAIILSPIMLVILLIGGFLDTE